MTASRRQFLESVGSGMLIAGLGPALAQELGFGSVLARDTADSLDFGPYDSLVDILQSTPLDRLQPLLVEKLNCGEANLQKLIAAGALANAEAFGGEDYTGFHTAMAMLPALNMLNLLPTERQPLPILKVIYRNSAQIQALGGPSKKTLRELHAAEEATVENRALAIRDACRVGDVEKAEKLFAPLADAKLDEPFNALLPAMQDEIN